MARIWSLTIACFAISMLSLGDTTTHSASRPRMVDIADADGLWMKRFVAMRELYTEFAPNSFYRCFPELDSYSTLLGSSFAVRRFDLGVMAWETMRRDLATSYSAVEMCELFEDMVLIPELRGSKDVNGQRIPEEQLLRAQFLAVRDIGNVHMFHLRPRRISSSRFAELVYSLHDSIPTLAIMQTYRDIVGRMRQNGIHSAEYIAADFFTLAPRGREKEFIRILYDQLYEEEGEYYHYVLGCMSIVAGCASYNRFCVPDHISSETLTY